MMLNKLLCKFIPIAAAALLALPCSAASGPESVAFEYFSTISAGEIDQALELMEFSEDIPEEEAEVASALPNKLQELKAEFDRRGGVASIDVFIAGDPENLQDGEEIGARVLIMFKNNVYPADAHVYMLVKRGSQWKMTHRKKHALWFEDIDPLN